MKTYKIAVIPGDGIGPEVIGETIKILEKSGENFGFSFKWVNYPFGAGHYLTTGEVMPEQAMEEMSKCDAMLLGAIGDPRVKPGILEQGILLAFRFRFDQYVNLRPAFSLPKVNTPVDLKGTKMDSVVVRENTEDLYMCIGGITETGELELPVDVSRGKYELKGTISLKNRSSLSLRGTGCDKQQAGSRKDHQIRMRSCKKTRRRYCDRCIKIQCGLGPLRIF